MAITWTRTPVDPTEGVGLAYTREPGYRVVRLGKSNGWMVYDGADFLGTAPRLAEGKALTWKHEIEQAWIDALYEDRARGMADWNLIQARAGAALRNKARQLAAFDRELKRRKTLLAERAAAVAAAERRARTEYTLHGYRAQFSEGVFNHIFAPGVGRSLCGPLYDTGPGEALDLAKVDCLACMERYAAHELAGAR